jgi:hypothetical protein
MPDLAVDAGVIAQLDDVLVAARRIGAAFLAMVNGSVPIFLIPEPGRQYFGLESGTRVRLRFTGSSWYVHRAEDEAILFSFDMPLALVALYAETGSLSPLEAIQLKAEAFSSLTFAMVSPDGEARLLTLRLDNEWLAMVKAHYARLLDE